MKSKNDAAAVAHLILVAVLIAAPLGTTSAFDRSGARTFELERDVRTARSRVERAPRVSSFELKELQRRLHEGVSMIRATPGWRPSRSSCIACAPRPIARRADQAAQLCRGAGR